MNLNGPEFYPTNVDYLLVSEVEQAALAPFNASIALYTSCIATTNPACPDQSDYRNIDDVTGGTSAPPTTTAPPPDTTAPPPPTTTAPPPDK